MIQAHNMNRLSDEAAIRRLAEGYARAVDRNDSASIAKMFVADAVIEGPGFVMKGLEAISGIPAMLKQRYHSTLHVVGNQTVQFSGDDAEAETYCFAHHLTALGEGKAIGDASNDACDDIWAIRYLDKLQRDSGGWRFTHRLLVIEWTEKRTVRLTPAGK